MADERFEKERYEAIHKYLTGHYPASGEFGQGFDKGWQAGVQSHREAVGKRLRERADQLDKRADDCMGRDLRASAIQYRGIAAAFRHEANSFDPPVVAGQMKGGE